LLGEELDTEARAAWPQEFVTLSDVKQLENIELFLAMNPGPEFERLAISTAADIALPVLGKTEKDSALEAWDKEKTAQEEREAERDDQLFDIEGAEEGTNISGQKAALNPQVVGRPAASQS
jgi:hypothetical protein